MPKLKNKYAIRSRITERKLRELIRYYAHDLDATTIAALSKLNRNTVNRYLLLIRLRIAELCERETSCKGEIEVDESYFGPHRVRGKRGRGAGCKTPVFGIFERGGMVYTEIVPDCSRARLQAVIRGRVALDSVIHSDGWPGYDGLVDLGYKKHLRVRHGQNEFSQGLNHINGIESFWAYAKARLAKFNGVAREMFYLHLKECEFRFNHRKDNLYAKLLELLRNQPLC
jgi:transposase-like protein